MKKIFTLLTALLLGLLPLGLVSAHQVRDAYSGFLYAGTAAQTCRKFEVMGMSEYLPHGSYTLAAIKAAVAMEISGQSPRWRQAADISNAVQTCDLSNIKAEYAIVDCGKAGQEELALRLSSPGSDFRLFVIVKEGGGSLEIVSVNCDNESDGMLHNSTLCTNGVLSTDYADGCARVIRAIDEYGNDPRAVVCRRHCGMGVMEIDSTLGYNPGDLYYTLTDEFVVWELTAGEIYGPTLYAMVESYSAENRQWEELIVSRLQERGATFVSEGEFHALAQKAFAEYPGEPVVWRRVDSPITAAAHND